MIQGSRAHLHIASNLLALIAFLSLPFFTAPLAATGCIDYENFASLIATASPVLPPVPSLHGFTDLEVSPPLAVCTALGPYGFQTVDISEVGDPRIIAAISLPSNDGLDVSSSGSFSYVANGSSGLQVVDITDNASPVLVSSVQTPSPLHRIVIQQQLLIAVCHNDYENSGHIVFMDLADPTRPRELSTLTLSAQPVFAVAQGSFAYVAVSDITSPGGSLLVIDGLDTYAAHIATNLPLPFRPTSLALQDTTLAIGLDNFALCLYSTANPVTPRPLSTIPLGARIDCITLSSPFAFLGISEHGISVLNLSDPSRPEIIGALPTASNNPTSIMAASNSMWCTDVGEWNQVAGISSFRLCNSRLAPLHTMLPETTFDGQPVVDILAGFRAIYYASQTSLAVCQMSLSDDLPILSSIPISGIVYQIASGTDWLAALSADYGDLGNNHLAVYDMRSPSTPRLIGDVALGRSLCKICPLGDEAIAIAHPDRSVSLIRIDLSGPITLASIGYMETSARALAGDGDILSVATTNAQVLFYDMSTQGSLRLMAAIPMPGECTGLDFRDNLLFAVGGATSPATFANYGYLGIIDLGLLDIAPSATIFQLPTYARNVKTYGAAAYLIGPAGLLVLDVTSPFAPSMIGTVFPGHRITAACTSPFGLLLGGNDGTVKLASFSCLSAASAPGYRLRAVPFEQCTLLSDESAGVQQGNRAIVAEGTSTARLVATTESSSRLQVLDCDRFAMADTLTQYSLWSYESLRGWSFLTALAVPAEPFADLDASFVRSVPNPCQTSARLLYHVSGGLLRKLALYNVRGQLAADLTPLASTASSGIVEWNGMLDSGGLAPSGVYIAFLRTTCDVATAKVVLVR